MERERKVVDDVKDITTKEILKAATRYTDFKRDGVFSQLCRVYRCDDKLIHTAIKREVEAGNLEPGLSNNRVKITDKGRAFLRKW